MGGTLGELLIVSGIATAMRLESFKVLSELLWVHLVRLGSLPRVDEDLIENLEEKHEQA